MNYEYDIKRFVRNDDYIKGRRFPSYYIRLYKRQIRNDEIILLYNVESENTYKQYDVAVVTSNHEIIGHSCTCPRYEEAHSCKHVAAVLINNYKDIVRFTSNDLIKNISASIINSFDELDNKGTIKEEIGLEVELNPGGYQSNVTIKIGKEKKYVLKNKIRYFLDAYNTNSGTVEFGKNFIYDPKKHYFSPDNEKIIKYLDNYFRYHNSFYFEDDDLKSFINLIKDRPFSLDEIGTIYEIKEGNPFESKITKKNDIYELNIDYSNMYPITRDFEYILKGRELYKIDKKLANLIMKLDRNGMNCLYFDEKGINNFSKRVLPIIKENVTVDENIDNIVVVKKPECRLYFDLNYNDIVCNLKFIYGNIEVDYFDNDSRVLRDYEYESEVITDLKKVGFEIDKNKIKLEDVDLIGKFLEEDINYLTEKYNVFTSEKLKEVDIVKTSNITSTFSIGKDNIMRYSFDLGDISTDELDNLFKNLKAKKKYFKLKSGNYLNLENDNIKELENLVDDINLSSKDIKNGNGIIPKYRAIYLDSLKDRYNIIKTNSLFDEFINTFLKYKDTKLSLTKKDKEILRDYQEVGVKWLYNIYKCGFGGILADEMGLGKSVQIIYLIKKLLKEDKDSKYLIVSPTSLVYNWENEFKKFAPDIKYETFGDIKNIRHEKLEKDNPSVYITSYGLLREDYEYYKDIKFNICVIDEAQNIKNPNAGITKTVKSINANTKFALTGTPIENSAIELWSIFDYCMDGFLGGQQEFGRKYSVKDFDEDTNKKLQNLNKLISPFVLRRRKVDVLNDLPDKIENNIYIDLSDSQKKLYAKEVERVNKEFDNILHTEGISKARFLILQLLVKLRQLCIDPRIVYENYKDGSNKIDTLISVVKEYVSNGHKILLFTSFRTALDLVRKEFNKNGITSYTIDGSVSSKKRMELVDKFNSDDTNVFLIMLKSGGTGLNLTSADVVIHLDLWWNPQAESQATDRAHRIGQKNNVEVIKLISKGTIEEKILELQQKKKLLSDKVIEGENMDKNVISKLTEKELKELLSYEQKNSDK